MYQEERLVKILEVLNKEQSMSVAEICEHFSVSRDTARRDIVKLVDQGAAIRTHGGISLPSIKDTILAYRERVQSYSKEKMNIGQYALHFIKEKQMYFLDVSTTVCYVAEQLNKQVKVYTHSLDIAEVLSNQSNASVDLFGGTLHKQNRFFYGPESADQLNKLRFEAAFFGAAAIMEDGIYFDDKEDAHFKTLVAKKSSNNILLADFNKFTKSSHYKGLEWEMIQIIITDKNPPPIFQDIMEQYHIELIITE